MGGAQVLVLVTLLGTLGTPRAVGRPTDVWGGPIDAGRPIDVGHPIDMGRSIDVGHPIDVGRHIDVGRPIDVGRSIDVGRPKDVGGGPIDVGDGPMDVMLPIDVGGSPMDVVLPIAVGRPMDVWGGPTDVWGGPPGVWGGGRPPCGPVNVTVSLEKDECPQCRAVTTTACAGFCRTRAPVYRSPLGRPAQSACVFGGVRYERRLLGGCPPGVDPAVAVPVAVGCRCAPCPMAAADCAVRGLGPAFCGAAGGRGAQ